MTEGHRRDPNSGLYLPAEVGVPDTVPASWSGRTAVDTAPIDVVDDTEATPADSESEPGRQPAAEPESTTPPAPAKTNSEQETQSEKVKSSRDPVVRPAFARLIDRITENRAAKPAKSKKHQREPITRSQVTTVCVMAAVVSLGAFVLSFDMMAVAAEHYGWTGWLAKLFPVVIDAGAVAGVVMAGLTSNPVFRRNGWVLGGLTLAASLVFNVTGHAIVGGGVLGLPESYAWTSTAAALLVPCLLAVFVHSAAVALHQWTAQERGRRDRAQRQAAVSVQTAAEPAPQPTKTTKSKKAAKPSRADALAVARDRGITSAPQLRKAMAEAGWTTTSVSDQTWRNWAAAAR